MKYLIVSFLWLALTILMAFGVTDVTNYPLGELLGLAVIAAIFAFFINRHPEAEDRNTGLISFDDDD